MLNGKKWMGLVMLGVAMLLFAAPLSAQEKNAKPRIAVLDINPSGVPQTLAVSVTDLFSTEMVNTGMFEVVERMQVAKILNEMGFQQTGVTDSSAAVEVGKMLNTKLVVIGTIGKLGQKLVLTAKIVEVEKGKILFAEKEMANGEDDLVGACEELANKLVFNITGVKVKNRKTSRVQGTSPAPAPQTTAQPAPAAQPAPVETKADPKKKDKKPVKEKDPVRKHSKEAMNELDDM